MGNPNFGEALKKERKVRGASLNSLGVEMQKFGAGKGAAANLSRLESGRHESPTEKRVRQIAKALSSYSEDSWVEQDQLLQRLTSAAGFGGITDEAQISYLRRKARKRLETSPDLKAHDIESILGQVSVATLKQVAETPEDERIAVVDLTSIATELSNKAQEIVRSTANRTDFDAKDMPDAVFPAGRARIHVDGPLTDDQKRLLKDAAALIRNALA